jgi:hypothetical protein
VPNKFWAKNSPAKNYPLNAKKFLSEELSGEELSVLCKEKFERRILRRRTVRAKNYPLNAK